MNKVKKNIILQTSYQVLSLITPFITAPYVARVLGAKQVGVYAYTYSIVNYFIVFAMLGLDIYGIREIAKVKGDVDKQNCVFSEIFYAHSLVAISVLCIYLFFCLIWGGEYQILFIIQSLYIIGAIFNINWLFNGLGEFTVTVVRNCIINVLTILAIFIFVKSPDDLIVYVSIMAIGMPLSTSAVWVVRKKYASFQKVPFKAVIRHIKPLTILFVSIIASSVFRMIDKTMMGGFGFITQLGCYEYADKIVRMPLAVFTGVGTVMMSQSSNLISNGKQEKVITTLKTTLIYMTLLSSLMVFGLVALGTEFSILYLGEEFEFTGSLLKYLSISLLLIAWSDTIRTQYYVPYGKDTIYAVLTGGGALLNIVMNALLIPFLGGRGAAVATVFSYLIMLIALIIRSAKEINYSSFIGSCILPFFTGIPPLIVVLCIKRYLPVTWLGLLVNIFIFVLLFLAISILVLKNRINMKLFFNNRRRL